MTSLRLFVGLAVLSCVHLAGCACFGRPGLSQEEPKVEIDWDAICNPVIDAGDDTALRDPALVYHDGLFRCFLSVVRAKPDGGSLWCVGLTTSPDLLHWSRIRLLTTSPLNFSSPGNVIRTGGKWVLCVQSYPIDPGRRWANEDCRLWLMESEDLEDWSDPRPMNPGGCRARWTDSHRQIDPYIVPYAGRFWCLYKTSGSLGLLVSDDLARWEEASPDRPILSKADTPDGATVENPCVVRDGDEFVMFFAPCRKGRGIGSARSDDLLHWRDVKYLPFPDLPWAPKGPTAPVVIDLRDVCGKWLMAFHGSGEVGPYGSGKIGLAWSDDLAHWQVP